jgi:hypothetical protein
MACADAAPPTQPHENRAKSAGARAATDVILTTASTPTTYYACYVPDKGTLYRIKTSDTPSACDKKDVEFSWTTDLGAAPIKGIEFNSAGVTLPSDGRFIAQCPVGKTMLNFGWEIPSGTSTASASEIRANRPAFINGRVAWGFVAKPGTVYAFYWNCADADPVTLAP